MIFFQFDEPHLFISSVAQPPISIFFKKVRDGWWMEDANDASEMSCLILALLFRISDDLMIDPQVAQFSPPNSQF